MSSTTLPDFVEERIDRIKKRTEISADEIRRDYEEIFGDDFIQEDPQFQLDEARHHYAVMVLWARYVARPPAKEVTVIPESIPDMETEEAEDK